MDGSQCGAESLARSRNPCKAENSGSLMVTKLFFQKERLSFRQNSRHGDMVTLHLKHSLRVFRI